MTGAEKKEMNKAIALMLGYEIKDITTQIRGGSITKKCLYGPDGLPTDFYHTKPRAYQATEDELFEELEFASDWELLMSAVEFIESLEFEFHGKIGVHISSNNCTMQGTKLRLDPKNFHPALFMDFYGENKKQATFIAVSEFARRYNLGEISHFEGLNDRIF